MDIRHDRHAVTRLIWLLVLLSATAAGACGGGPGESSIPPVTLSAEVQAIVDSLRNPPLPPPQPQAEIDDLLSQSFPSFEFTPALLDQIRNRNQQRFYCTNYDFVFDDDVARPLCVAWEFGRAPPNFRCESCPSSLQTGVVPESNLFDGLDLSDPLAVWEDPGWRSRFALFGDDVAKLEVQQVDSLRFFLREVDAARPSTLSSFQAEIDVAVRSLARALRVLG